MFSALLSDVYWEDDSDPVVFPTGVNWEGHFCFLCLLFFLCYEMAVRKSERPVLRLPPNFPDLTSLLSYRSGMVVAWCDSAKGYLSHILRISFFYTNFVFVFGWQMASQLKWISLYVTCSFDICLAWLPKLPFCLAWLPKIAIRHCVRNLIIYISILFVKLS